MTPSRFDVPHASTFALSITRALALQLHESLSALTTAPLDVANIHRLEDLPGVYQLFLDDRSVYIGKADKSLPKRLLKHQRKIEGRQSVDGEGLGHRMSFRCLYVNEDLHAIAPERMLIQRLKIEGLATWNHNGFGNNDPGKNRDTSIVKEAHFDRAYPIDLDRIVTLQTHDKETSFDNIAEVMDYLKKSLPYLFRYPTKGPDYQELKQLKLSATDFHLEETQLARDWLSLIAEQLPPSWLITALPGYIICYKDPSPEAYESRLGSWRAGTVPAYFQPHQPRFDHGNKVIEEEFTTDEDLS